MAEIIDIKEPLFWYTVAFVIFIALVWMNARKPVLKFFDDYAIKIRDELREATKIHDEATVFLAETQTKHANAVKEADAILSQARQQAQLIRGQAERELDTLLKRHEQQALDRIRILEEQATKDVRAQTIETALKAAEHILRTELSADQDKQLVSQQISHMGQSLRKVA